MKRKNITRRIQRIIAMMMISVLGVVGLQAYWIKNAIDMREVQFDKQVQLALNRTNWEIEDIETLNVFAEFTDDSNRSMRPSQRMLSRGNIDSIETVLFTGSEDGSTVTVIIDTVGKDGHTYSLQIEISSHSINDENSNVELNHTRQMVWMEHQKVQEKYEQIGGVMDKVFIEMMREPRSLDERLKNIPLEEVLLHNLLIHGVEIEFEFSVVNTSSQEVLGSENFNVNKGKFYQASLFPNDLFSEQGLLLVDFPTRTRYVMESIWSVLLLSLMFTGIVIFAFWRIVNMLFSQKRLSEIKSDFINNMTHEFKTPIATIGLAADSIQAPGVIVDQDRIKHYIGLIKEENQRMNNQVERILQMSLLDKEDLQVRTETINLNELVGEVCAHFKLKVIAKGGMLEFEVPEDAIFLDLDRLHLFQSLSNLVDNALKYSKEVPHIMVLLTSSKEMVCIEVQDQGVGISKEHLNNIFEKFYRISTGDVHDVKGHGLGLNYVKRIIEKMKGSIEVSSIYGEGSSFKLVFPKQ